ncbi:Tn3 family transposase [Escherichia coli]|uniref:Tn3 family transposase n=1 Tax=Escherichia coli TaxID=562 RepID=UPI003983712A
MHAGLNKGEARNSLAVAVFFNRLGEIRDRSFEQQRYRASGLNTVTAAIVLWNTVYPNAPPRGWSRPASRWTASCCNSCRRWAGSTST